MNKEEIIETLSSWNFWNQGLDTGIDRDKYLEKLDALINTGQITAIIGARRSGKSTLMKQFIKRQIAKGKDRLSFLYVNFEEPKFSDLLSLESLQQIYDAYMEIVKPGSIPYILLDEIQNVPKWERFARGVHEKKQAHLIVSGSTSKLLSKEYGTLLTGRWVKLEVYPINFSEFLKFKNLDVSQRINLLSNKVKVKQLLREYLEFGGFPLAVLNAEKQEILKRYFDDIIIRDVTQRHKVRRVEKLRSLAKYYLTNFSSPMSYRKVKKFMDLSLDSVERFSVYMQEAYLLFFVPKFSYSLKEQEVNLKVVYGIDCGLINVVNFRFSDNIGKLYENVVYLALLQKSKEIYYYKDKGECDFIVKDGQKVTKAIQVSYQIKENKQREINGLLDAMKKFRLKEGIIITDDLEAEEKVENKKIKYIPLWKWLLAN